MRLLNRADCDDSHKRFVQRIVEKEIVWYLSNSEGVAHSESNDDEESTVLIFWSDEAYARRAKNETFPEYEETSMDLFDFLFRWLPGMSGDGALAGTNWTHDLIGVESDPFELREEIENEMSEDQRERHKLKYESLTK
jgi:hypothetical protein